jgi:cyclophilin family peptidyl-prolyl cis-trans isomerase
MASDLARLSKKSAPTRTSRPRTPCRPELRAVISFAMMKSSNPSISNPLSRSKKRGGTLPIIFVGILFLGAVIFGVFYVTVYQAMEAPPPRPEYVGQRLNGVPHPNLNGFQRHHAHRDIQDYGIDPASVDSYHGTVILSTAMGDIKIILQPELSPESVAYVHDIAKNGCDRCAFYRTEKPGIFQGMIKSESIPPITVKGKCPPDDVGTKQDCPEHDKNCGCHGPIMTKGMVGWAGGGTGPDFFIDTYENPAFFWGNQHT